MGKGFEGINGGWGRRRGKREVGWDEMRWGGRKGGEDDEMRSVHIPDLANEGKNIY